DLGALVDAEQALGVGGAKRPGRHEEPPGDSPDVGDDQEEQDAARYRRIKFRDAVPLMAGGFPPSDRILFLHFCHGLSSRSSMLFLARSKRFLLEGQNA